MLTGESARRDRHGVRSGQAKGSRCEVKRSGWCRGGRYEQRRTLDHLNDGLDVCSVLGVCQLFVADYYRVKSCWTASYRLRCASLLNSSEGAGGLSGSPPCATAWQRGQSQGVAVLPLGPVAWTAARASRAPCWWRSGRHSTWNMRLQGSPLNLPSQRRFASPSALVQTETYPSPGAGSTRTACYQHRRTRPKTLSPWRPHRRRARLRRHEPRRQKGSERAAHRANAACRRRSQAPQAIIPSTSSRLMKLSSCPGPRPPHVHSFLPPPPLHARARALPGLRH